MTAEAARWSVRHLCIYHGDARLLLHDPTTRPPAAHNLSVGWSYDACRMLDTTVRKHKVMTLSTPIRGPTTTHDMKSFSEESWKDVMIAIAEHVVVT